jgi:hypothetical protein
MNFYATIDQTKTFAVSIGEKRFAPLTVAEKTLILYRATQDIEQYHGQPRESYNQPWKYGNIWLREACIYQAMLLTRTIKVREFKDAAKAITNGNYSDGTISVSGFNSTQLDPISENLVDKALVDFNIGNAPEFERGG